MEGMRKISILLALAALLVAPGSASAFHQPGSEGNSALEQYQEDLPGAGGDRPRHQEQGGPGGSPLTSKQAEALEARGPVGAAVAELAALTAPGSDGGDGTGSGGASGGQGGGPEVTGVQAASEEGSGLGSVLDAVFGGLGGGMGIALPLILAASLGAAIALLVARRRSRGAEPPAA